MQLAGEDEPQDPERYGAGIGTPASYSQILNFDVGTVVPRVCNYGVEWSNVPLRSEELSKVLQEVVWCHTAHTVAAAEWTSSPQSPLRRCTCRALRVTPSLLNPHRSVMTCTSLVLISVKGRAGAGLSRNEALP